MSRKTLGFILSVVVLMLVLVDLYSYLEEYEKYQKTDNFLTEKEGKYITSWLNERNWQQTGIPEFLVKDITFNFDFEFRVIERISSGVYLLEVSAVYQEVRFTEKGLFWRQWGTDAGGRDYLYDFVPVEFHKPKKAYVAFYPPSLFSHQRPPVFIWEAD